MGWFGTLAMSSSYGQMCFSRLLTSGSIKLLCPEAVEEDLKVNRKLLRPASLESLEPDPEPGDGGFAMLAVGASLVTRLRCITMDSGNNSRAGGSFMLGVSPLYRNYARKRQKQDGMQCPTFR